eukprot:TRINITY_DN11892_c0_g1_i2.p1 TRINITY_DN11892_c0_g1~~TRINITY_DN11892_c0_g1_i2.p1  ORF type:complete len:577 (+),score=112.32 TRINITY_DN11892_c0_g1_i2:28-1758(+)
MCIRDRDNRMETKLFDLCGLESHDWNRAKDQNRVALESLLKQIEDAGVSAGKGMSPKKMFHKRLEAREHMMTREGETPISTAATAGNVEVLQMLVSYGYMIATTNCRGQTPLHLAIANKHVEATKLLIEATRKGIGVMVPDEYVDEQQDFMHYTPPTLNQHHPISYQPVYRIPRSRHRGIALDLEAFYEARDTYGYTALHYCVKDPAMWSCIPALVNAGANPNTNAENAHHIEYDANMTQRKVRSPFDTLLTHPMTDIVFSSLKALSPPSTSTSTQEGMEQIRFPVASSPRVSRFVGIQICSDLHLEGIRPWPPRDITAIVKPAAKYLALVGDIGVLTHDTDKRYEHFLLEMAKHFDKVFVVLGNHEYYHGEKREVEEEARRICNKAPEKLVFGYKYSGLLVDGVRVLATTLWSHIPNDEDHINGVWKGLNDYRLIEVEDDKKMRRVITWKDTHSWFEDESAWLAEEVKRASQNGEQCIVLTHHCPILGPLGVSACKYYHSPIRSGFRSDLRRLMATTTTTADNQQRNTISMWAFGHTHWFTDHIQHGSTRIVSNPKGYTSQDLCYQNTFVVDIDY